MHPSILAQRKAKAMNRIIQAAQLLDPEHAEALQPKGIKDTNAADMMRLEAIADLLDRLVPVTAVTDETGSGTETDPVDEPAEDGRPTLEDFPAHVVQPVADETIPIEGEPEIEEFPVEELPKEKPQRKPTKRAKKSTSTG